MEPPVGQGLGGGLGILEVPGEDVAAPHDDLAVGGDLDVDTGEGGADRPEPGAAGDVERRRAAVLRLAVDLVDREAEPGEELQDLLRHRSGAAHAEPGLPQAEPLLHLRVHDRVEDLVPAHVDEGGTEALRPARHDVAADGGGLLDQLGLDAVVLAQLLDHAGVELLPHPGHAEEQRRLHLDEVGVEPVERLGVVDGEAGHSGDVDGEHLLGHVRQRQVRHQPVAQGGAGQLAGLPGRPGEGVLREHHGLGPAGRARRVDEGRDRVGPEGGQPLVEGARGAGALGQEIVPAEHHRVVDGRPLHRHDLAEVGQLVAHRGDLLPLGLVLHQEDGRLGVVQDVGALPR